ncbi:UNVERIFIED_CONTAM: hypothetical protein HHA_318742 [Hammondia hammondi]|eukprot:XP_008885226.1 hypothetical protein HHA_318742 [Hammondia hammondi]
MESHVKNSARVVLVRPTSVKRAISHCNEGVTDENGEPHYISSVPQTKVFEALYEISFAGAFVHRYLKIRFPERQGTECLVVLRDSVQVARLIILLGESRLMACPIDANTILMAHAKCRASTSMAEKVVTTMKKSFFRDIFFPKVSLDHPGSITGNVVMQNLLWFCITCRLLETGSWIHIGENMESLIDARCLKGQEKRDRSHVNAPGVSLIVKIESDVLCPHKQHTVSFSIKAATFAARVLRLRDGCDTACVGDTVFCLPKLCAPGSIRGFVASHESADTLRTPEDFSSFWFLQHGYKLPPEATKTIVKVSFGYLTLHYPVGCCWRSKLIELPHITSDIRRIIATKVFKSCSDLQVIGDASIRLLSMRQSLQVSAACLEHARNLLRTIEPSQKSDVSTAGDIPWERKGETCYLENRSQTDALDKLNMKLEHRRLAPVVLPVRPLHHCRIERERSRYSVSLLPISEQLDSFKISEGDHVRSNGSAFPTDDSVADSIAKRSRRILPPRGTYGAGNRTNYPPVDGAQISLWRTTARTTDAFGPNDAKSTSDAARKLPPGPTAQCTQERLAVDETSSPRKIPKGAKRVQCAQLNVSVKRTKTTDVSRQSSTPSS